LSKWGPSTTNTTKMRTKKVFKPINKLSKFYFITLGQSHLYFDTILIVIYIIYLNSNFSNKSVNLNLKKLLTQDLQKQMIQEIKYIMSNMKYMVVILGLQFKKN